jgi:hypothetical protein
MNVSRRRSSSKTVLDLADGRDVDLPDRRQPDAVALGMHLEPERLEVGLKPGRAIEHANLRRRSPDTRARKTALSSRGRPFCLILCGA